MSIPEEAQAAQHLGRFKLRHATSRDYQRVRQFYDQNWSANLARRGDAWVKQATAERNIFLVEKESTREIVAVSAIKHWEVKKRAGDRSLFYIEAAASLTPRLGGFQPSLHTILHSVRCVSAVLSEPNLVAACPEFKYFGIILQGDHTRRSRENIQNAGFQLWEQPDEELKAAKDCSCHDHGGQNRDEVDWFFLPWQRLAIHARQLLAWQDGVRLSRINRATDQQETLDLVLDLEVLRYFRRDVEALQDGATPAELVGNDWFTLA